MLLEAGLQLLQRADKCVRVILVLDWVLPFQRTQSRLETLTNPQTPIWMRVHERDVISNTFLLLLHPHQRPPSSIDGCVDVGGVRLARFVLGSSVRAHRRDGGFGILLLSSFSPRK